METQIKNKQTTWSAGKHEWSSRDWFSDCIWLVEKVGLREFSGPITVGLEVNGNSKAMPDYFLQ